MNWKMNWKQWAGGLWRDGTLSFVMWWWVYGAVIALLFYNTPR
jgi:hypothetical protein